MRGESFVKKSATITAMTTWRGTRRAVLTGAVAAAAALSAAPAHMRAQSASTATPAAGPVSPSHLLVADRNVDRLYVYDIPGFSLTGQLENVGFGIHGGSLLLEDGRLLFADVLNDEIVALTIAATGQPEISQRVAARFGGGVSWISADPALTHVAFGSLLGEEDETDPHQFVNILDLADFTNTALEFTMEAPEEITPWLLGDPLHLHLHVAVGGEIQSFVLDDLLAGETIPLTTVPVDLDSHGGATDPRNQRLFYTTGPGTGFEVLDVAAGPAEYVRQIPWDLDGLAGGRNARPRVLPDGVHVFGVMTPGLDDPGLWAETMVSNHITNMETLTARRVPIDVGTIGYRWGVTDKYVLWAGYNADGARAYLLDADPQSPDFGSAIETIDVAMPSGAAKPGQDYEGSEFYLMTSITPDSAYGFVTISGDGHIQVLDLEAREVVAEIATPSPLAGGGYTTVVQSGIAPADLWAR
jgi:hypothetical protein